LNFIGELVDTPIATMLINEDLYILADGSIVVFDTRKFSTSNSTIPSECTGFMQKNGLVYISYPYSI
jgi:hypothetical protein